MKNPKLITTILLAVTVLVIVPVFVAPIHVLGESSSMKPNLYTGQWLMINKVIYGLHTPQRGDIVVFRSQYNTSSTIIFKI